MGGIKPSKGWWFHDCLKSIGMARFIPALVIFFKMEGALLKIPINSETR
jgi:hypothetical protein